VGFSQLSNPQSDSDFETIDHFVDYYAYQQWTQTNLTLQIAVPNIECAHCVIQIKYQPKKPTEPVFLQCVDVAIRYSQSLASDLSVNYQVPPLPSSSAALLPLIGLSEQGGGVVNVHSFDPTTGNVTNILQIDAYVSATGPQSPQAVSAYVSQDVIAVNRQDDILYLLKSNDYYGFPNLVLVIDLKNGTLTRQLPITGLNFAISGLYFDSLDGTLAVVGLKNSSSSWYYFGGKIDLTNGAFREIVASSADVSPYVDFAWSDYDPTSQSFYILARHEDQPTTLQAQLFTLNLQSPKVSVVDVSLDYIFSSFFIDSRTPNALLAFSPGPVDPSNGDVVSPKWQVIRIDPTTGSIGTVAAAPASANTFPIWWGGGVAGFSNGKATTAPDSNNFHFLAVSTPFFPHPRQLVALNFNLQTNTVTLAQLSNPLPFFFNVARV